MDFDKRRREHHIFYKGDILNKNKIVILPEIKKGGEKMRAKLIAPVTRDTGSKPLLVCEPFGGDPTCTWYG